MDRYLFIGATLGLTVLGQIILKWRSALHVDQGSISRFRYLISMYTDFWVLFCFACAVGASVSWSLAVQRTPLTVAYPFMALSFILVPAASVVLLRESISMLQIAGSVLIVLGVALSAATK